MQRLYVFDSASVTRLLLSDAVIEIPEISRELAVYVLDGILSKILHCGHSFGFYDVDGTLRSAMVVISPYMKSTIRKRIVSWTKKSNLTSEIHNRLIKLLKKLFKYNYTYGSINCRPRYKRWYTIVGLHLSQEHQDDFESFHKILSLNANLNDAGVVYSHLGIFKLIDSDKFTLTKTRSLFWVEKEIPFSSSFVATIESNLRFPIFGDSPKTRWMITDILTKAFLDDPFTNVIFHGKPNVSESDRVRRMYNSYLRLILEASVGLLGYSREGLTYCTEKAAVVGCVIYDRIEDSNWDLLFSFVVYMAPFFIINMLDFRVNRFPIWGVSGEDYLLGFHKTIMRKRPHLYVWMVGTAESKKGYGSTIMRSITSDADRLGIECYLENSKQKNLKFYEKHGFQTVQEVDFMGCILWLMVRPVFGVKLEIETDYSSSSSSGAGIE